MPKFEILKERRKKVRPQDTLGLIDYKLGEIHNYIKDDIQDKKEKEEAFNELKNSHTDLRARVNILMPSSLVLVIVGIYTLIHDFLKKG